MDAALKQAGVNVIMNLANSQEEAEAYEGFADTYYSGQKVIYLNLGVDFSAPEFQKGLAEGLRFFAANKGYLLCPLHRGQGPRGLCLRPARVLHGRDL